MTAAEQKAADLRSAIELHHQLQAPLLDSLAQFRPLVDLTQGLLDRLDAGLDVTGKICGVPFNCTRTSGRAAANHRVRTSEVYR